ncbi:hypothetical protein MBLNU457_4876t2 [Dothideomycetes sp. NU457]
MTTVDLSTRPANNPPESNTQEPPRKRRRRTATTGANDDCFTCQKRQAQCDRKRPYCGPCLEVGNECSGYKTTLTWGVGVASRGKLRGQTLPVAKQANHAHPIPKKDTKQKKSSPTETIARPEWNAVSGAGQTFTFQPSVTQPTDLRTIKAEDGSNNSSGHSIQLPPVQQWNTIQTPGQEQPTSPQYSLQYQAQSTPLQSRFDTFVSTPAHPGSTASANTYNDPNYFQPHDYAPDPASYSSAASYATHNPIPQAFPTPSTIADTQQRDVAYNDTDLDADQDNLPAMMPSDDVGYYPQITQYNAGGQDDPYTGYDPDVDDTLLDQSTAMDPALDSALALTIPRPLFSGQFYHLPPRMQTLFDFYDKHICSVLVAFDGDTNPYRAHILQLASQNEALQYAIAALATNNIRMRNHIQQSGFIVEELQDDEPRKVARSSIPPPTPEEQFFKRLSIESLNKQLIHPSIAQDDSVLATLLVLCLFHVCDSGFSKFNVQLAGVQKLLSLRGSDAQSGFLGWVQMFFTWFDVMTSTVNDREAQIRADNLDMYNFSSDLGALEQFSGCDGRLFKLIARLGRLNLLAQDRPVRLDAKISQIYPQPPRRFNKSNVMNAADYYRLDGNGWGTFVIDEEEEDGEGLVDSSSPPKSTFIPPDSRREFWHEWNDIRTRLQEWSMDSLPSSPISPNPSTAPGQRDLVHINECFRSSALLYTERLAHPALPSSATNFQSLVSGAFFHITSLSITSCVNKFLLWPLFIIGTECVNPIHRATIRQRCVEIQRESGFFNNLSVLEVLEKVWAETGPAEGCIGVEEEVIRRRRDSSGGQMGKRWGQAFRWRRAMDRVDVETKLELIRRLAQTGIQTIEAGSFVAPKWVPQMAASDKVLESILDTPPPSPAPINYQWLLPNMRGLENFYKIYNAAPRSTSYPTPPPSPTNDNGPALNTSAYDANAMPSSTSGVDAMESTSPDSAPQPSSPTHEISIFLAATESFSQRNTNCSISESLTRFQPLIKSARDASLRVRAYISVALGCPFEGAHVSPTVVADLAASLLSAGADEISVADTTGMGTAPRTRELLKTLHAAGIRNEDLALHFHDTYGQALINTLIGLEAGVRVFDSAVGGLGGCPYSPGATGNVATEDLVYMLESLGLSTGVDLEGVSGIGDWITRELGKGNESRAGKGTLGRLRREGKA